MNRLKRAPWTLLLLACAILLLPGKAGAQPPKPDLTAIIHDTQKMNAGSEQMVLVWWMPEEYWRVAFTQTGSGLTADAAEEMLKALRPYVLLAVIKGKIGPMGGVTYDPEPEIRRSLSLTGMDGKVYKPLPESEVAADVKNFLSVLKPIMASMLGPMGENLRVYAFPSKSSAGKVVADPTAEGRLTVQLAEERFEYRLPLGSLVPQKMCPEDKEKMSGAWSYCPWHGTKLVPASQP